MTAGMIGGVALRSKALLAPMAGVSDRAYRELCMAMGAGYCVSEMVSSKALSFGSKKSVELMEIDNSERPCGIQIFGDDPLCMLRSLRWRTSPTSLISIWAVRRRKSAAAAAAVR